ncbi:MAG: SDR family NAD(P)-dependent oxidoreductase [Muribaculaceae bacterium]|nr:SDR family NAD(P)-dependent oxidoreductase [Muribaculaceae bacterium]
MKDLSPLYIVTGTTGSIGGKIAETIAKEGKAVVLACRNIEKAELQKERLMQLTGNRDIHCRELKLDSFASVKSFCNELNAQGRRIASIVNNAGIMTHGSEISSCGYEMDFMVNVFSPALMSILLEPLLEKGASVVFTTSLTRDIWNLSECFPYEKHFGQLATYGRSKRALTMFAVWLACEYDKRGIRVNCADPGIVNTGMIRMQRWFDPLADVFFRPFISSPEKGALSALYAMKSMKTGIIYYHGKEKRPSGSIIGNAQVTAEKIMDVLKPFL